MQKIPAFFPKRCFYFTEADPKYRSFKFSFLDFGYYPFQSDIEKIDLEFSRLKL
jgi:hypothetical protein